MSPHEVKVKRTIRILAKAIERARSQGLLETVQAEVKELKRLKAIQRGFTKSLEDRI